MYTSSVLISQGNNFAWKITTGDVYRYCQQISCSDNAATLFTASSSSVIYQETHPYPCTKKASFHKHATKPCFENSSNVTRLYFPHWTLNESQHDSTQSIFHDTGSSSSPFAMIHDINSDQRVVRNVHVTKNFRGTQIVWNGQLLV